MRCAATIIAATCALSRFAAAVFADDAGVVDWHHVLLGYPLQDATFFHQPQQDSKATLVYTLSDRNVVAAVNPKDGEVIWRQALQSNTAHAAGLLRAGQTSDTVISGVGSEVTAWGAPDGRQIWSVSFGDSSVRDLEILELDEGREKASAKDCLVLAEGKTTKLLRLSGADGSKIWEYTDVSGDAPHQISASSTAVFLVSLHSTALGGHSIRITTLDPSTGKRTDQYTLSESDIPDASHIIAVGANSASPIIAWIDKSQSTLKVNIVGTKSVTTFNIAKAKGEQVEEIKVHAPSRSNSRSHFLVQYQTLAHSWAEVFHVDLKKSVVSKAYDLPKVAGKSAFSVTSDGSNVFFTRITQEEAVVVSSVSHGIIARWSLKGFDSHAQMKNVHPVHAATELSVKGEIVSAARSTVLLSSGDWVLVRDDTIAWSRPEELAHTVTAAFAYPPASSVEFQQELNKETELNVVSAYAYRWSRHIADLQRLPEFLATIPTRILASVGLHEEPHADISRAVRSFGFHKVIVCITSTGFAIGLDAGESGRILWKMSLPEAVRPQLGQQPILEAHAEGAMEVRSSLDAIQRSVFDGTTGGPLDARHHFNKPAGFVNVKDSTTGVAAIQPANTAGKALIPRSWWQFKVPSAETVVAMVARPVDDPVASIGRVLGDRRVLYKYLNPNLLLVATAPPDRNSLTVHLVDSLSGETLYTGVHADVISNLPFAAVISENWFAYTYTESSGDSGTTSSLLVVGELYESSLPDDHGGGNHSEQFPSSSPFIPLQSYIIPEPISQMTVSQTGQGITSKELLVTLPGSNALVGIPKGIIDPRRPVGRDPNKIEQFEGLMKYTPTLDFDPKWYLSHSRELFRITNVTTSPAILESTSLVFAYGLDAFGTRVTPSFSFDILGKDFNKLQMLATVFALGVGTVIVAPLVMRKQVNTQWSFMS